jgi:hypothetical protein
VITTGANKIADADVIMVVGETEAIVEAITALATARKQKQQLLE